MNMYRSSLSFALKQKSKKEKHLGGAPSIWEEKEKWLEIRRFYSPSDLNALSWRHISDHEEPSPYSLALRRRRPEKPVAHYRLRKTWGRNLERRDLVCWEKLLTAEKEIGNEEVTLGLAWLLLRPTIPSVRSVGLGPLTTSSHWTISPSSSLLPVLPSHFPCNKIATSPISCSLQSIFHLLREIEIRWSAALFFSAAALKSQSLERAKPFSGEVGCLHQKTFGCDQFCVSSWGCPFFAAWQLIIMHFRRCDLMCRRSSWVSIRFWAFRLESFGSWIVENSTLRPMTLQFCFMFAKCNYSRV